MSKKIIANLLYFLTNVAIFSFAAIYDSQHGLSGPSVTSNAFDIAEFMIRLPTVIEFLIVIFGQSIVFYFPVNKINNNMGTIILFILLNATSALFNLNCFLTQTDPSKVFFFAIHWGTSWILAIIAAVFVCIIRKETKQ